MELQVKIKSLSFVWCCWVLFYHHGGRTKNLTQLSILAPFLQLAFGSMVMQEARRCRTESCLSSLEWVTADQPDVL